MKTHIIYIPGLGPTYDPARRFALKFWRLGGVSTELVEMAWKDGDSFDTKYRAVVKSIEKARTLNRKVVLIGESAGASMALVAASNISAVRGCITLCGVSLPSTPIATPLRRASPALDEAVGRLKNVAITVPLVSLRSAFDPVIGKKYSTAKGAKPHIIWSVGHMTTIILCMTLYAPYVIKIAKKL
jgi:hypothetical protein